jgi:catechol 2,3-dioxygenase-like lactoylglutathione lyase family enzyme
MSTVVAPTVTPINPQTSGMHHVTIRCTDLARARLFYIERLGFPVVLEEEGLFIFAAGQSAFGVRGPASETRADDAFDPFRVGLDHIALACNDAVELRRFADALAAAGIENTGVKTCSTLGKEYVAFKDPDGVKWELYMA